MIFSMGFGAGVSFSFLLTYLLIGVFAIYSTGYTAESSVPSPSAPPAGVTLRVGLHTDFVRIVFTVPDDSIRQVTVSPMNRTTLKVDIPPPFILTAADRGVQKTDTSFDAARGVKVIVKEAFCMIIIDGLTEYRSAKIASPSRLVIDAYLAPQPKSPQEKAASPPPQPPPQTESTSHQIRFTTIVIDPGHGGYDRGIKFGESSEKDLTMSLSKDIANALSKKGRKVVLTRKSDQNLPIRERVRAAQKSAPALFLSIHVSPGNRFGFFIAPKKEPQEQGAAPTEDSYPASRAVMNSLVGSLKGDFTAPVKEYELPTPLVRDHSLPAVLIELPGPDSFSYDKKNREALINALVKGILNAQKAP